MQRRNRNHDDRELLREGQSLLRQLDLPLPCSVGALRDHVQRSRGRPLIILPLPSPAGEESPFGLWAEYPDADFILHEAHTTPVHRDQIILHEMTHILLGHGAVTSFTSSARPVSSRTASYFRSRMPAAVKTRLTYSKAEEWQAEIIASLLMTRMPLDVNRRTWDHSDLHALGPLWSRLTSAAPEIVLCPSLARTDETGVNSADLRLRLGRCIVEIRDAELLLRAYVSDASTASARTALAAAGLVGEELEATTEAVWLRAATAARLAGRPPVTPAPTRPLRGGSDVAAEARWLRLVAVAWGRPAVVSAAVAISLPSSRNL